MNIAWTGATTVAAAVLAAPPPVQSGAAFVFGFLVLRRVLQRNPL